ncbi:hypothetical protein MRX96_054597 [Rhipicephalus microplus]
MYICPDGCRAIKWRPELPDSGSAFRDTFWSFVRAVRGRLCSNDASGRAVALHSYTVNSARRHVMAMGSRRVRRRRAGKARVGNRKEAEEARTPELRIGDAIVPRCQPAMAPQLGERHVTVPEGYHRYEQLLVSLIGPQLCASAIPVFSAASPSDVPFCLEGHVVFGGGTSLDFPIAPRAR